MANQTSKPEPTDVADGRGHLAPASLPGEPEWDPDDAPDAAATHGRDDHDAPGHRIGTYGAAIEDLADPGADANSPDPSRPITMAAGPGAGHGIPGGGYGDSRAPDDPPIRDDVDNDSEQPASGSHLSEDDTKGPAAPAEHPAVGQPKNVTQSRRP